MKKNKLFGLTLVATILGALFSSCSGEEKITLPGSEIQLTSEITPSRVTSLNYQSTQIVEGQEVGVTITGANSAHKNVAWKAEANGTLSNMSETLYWGKNDITITAYHPYNSAWTDSIQTFSVNSDQSVDANYLNSDLLWTKKSASKTENPVPLTFSHKLAKINVTLTSTDIEDLSGSTISICGINITTIFNLATGSLSAATTNIAEIKAGVTTAIDYTASAIVIPQTVNAGTKFIKVEYDGRTFYYTLTADKELKSGYAYNYTLNVKEKKIEIDLDSDNITDWEDENNSGDAEEENNDTFNHIIIKNQQLSSALLAELGASKVTINNEGFALMNKDVVLAETELDFGNNEYIISSLEGIEYFSNLQKLRCNYTQLAKCDLSNNKALKDVSLCGSLLTTLDVSNLTELHSLSCAYSSSLSNLIMTNCNKLGHLECMDTLLDSINFPNPDIVWQLICGGNHNLKVNLSLYPNLTVLGLVDMGLTDLTMIPDAIKPNLTWFSVENNSLESLDLSEYSNLGILECTKNNLSQLNLTPVTKLTNLGLRQNKISSLDITCLPNLESLYCGTQQDSMSLRLTLTENQKIIWDSTWHEFGNLVTLNVVTGQ